MKTIALQLHVIVYVATERVKHENHVISVPLILEMLVQESNEDAHSLFVHPCAASELHINVGWRRLHDAFVFSLSNCVCVQQKNLRHFPLKAGHAANEASVRHARTLSATIVGLGWLRITIAGAHHVPMEIPLKRTH